MPGKLTGAAPVWREVDRDRHRVELELTTITPMFGGGATPREIDDPPIRAASIRGHLRFWWRATSGSRYETAEELFAAERDIWGDTSAPGKVVVRVTISDSGKPIKPSNLLPNKPAATGPCESFFLFPFQEIKKDNLPEATGRSNIAFHVTVDATLLDAPSLEPLYRSIRAWLIFGGVGARTRRGCGSLRCSDETGQWLPTSIRDVLEYLAPEVNTGDEYPQLSGGWVMFDKPDAADRCWRTLGTFWSRFRKGHFTAKRQGYSPMSGCDWLDHSTLKAAAHQRPIALVKPYLGLPIIYQKFPGTFAGEVTPEGSGRMASPIILKPVAFGDGSIRPMVACLAAPNPNRIEFGRGVVPLSVPTNDPVMRALGSNAPLEAVRQAARRRGFEEVTL